jgi:hypothetical protein
MFFFKVPFAEYFQVLVLLLRFLHFSAMLFPLRYYCKH